MENVFENKDEQNVHQRYNGINIRDLKQSNHQFIKSYHNEHKCKNKQIRKTTHQNVQGIPFYKQIHCTSQMGIHLTTFGPFSDSRPHCLSGYRRLGPVPWSARAQGLPRSSQVQVRVWREGSPHR